MAGAFVEEMLRQNQAQLYLEMLNSVKSGSFASVLRLDKRLTNTPITINTSSHCSCGRFFEQHPTFIEDRDEVNMEIFLHSVTTGYCKCLNSPDEAQQIGLLEVGKKCIHVAAALGSLKLMKQLIKEAECDINETTSVFQFTPLSLAVMQTRDEMVKWLCDQANINVNIKSKREKHTPLVDAMLAEKYHLVEVLARAKGVDLNAANFRNETPLIIAVRMRNSRLVGQLLEAGADHTVTTSDGTSPLMHAANAGKEVVEEFINANVPLNTIDANGETALTKSVRQRNLEVTDVLIRGGANPRANPAIPALVLAANVGSFQTMVYLLDIGQDPNQVDDKGWTALHFACLKGFTVMVQVLLSYAANPDGSDLCNTCPLGLAIFHRHLTIVKTLLASGCKVNRFDNELDTPLHYAAVNGDLDAVQLLLDHGSMTCAYNGIGATPLYNATVSNNTSIVKLLLPFYIDTDLNTQSQGFEYFDTDAKSILFDDCSRSLLWLAANNANEVIMTYLLDAGFDASKEEWIQNRQFPAFLQSREQALLTNLLIAVACNPPSLMSLCRCTVRRALGPAKQRNVHCINIPRKMKNYIMLRDREN